jgi:hypothetical protein
VQHLNRRSKVSDAFGKFPGAADHACGFHTEDGTQSLAACEDTVTHRAMNRVGQCVRGREKSFQGGVGQRNAGR